MCQNCQLVLVSLLLQTMIASLGHADQLSNDTHSGFKKPSSPRVHFVAFVAYYGPFVIPAIHVAIKGASRGNANVTFTYSTLSNPGDPSCDQFNGLVTNYLANYYYKLQEQPDVYLIVLATGCSTATAGTADLAREWDIPIVVSAGTGNELRDKRRYPSLVGFMPADYGAYSHVFRHLMDWYKWRTVSIICDPMASEMAGSYYANEYRGMCDSWARILSPRYTVFALTANLTSSASRKNALIQARAQCRVIVIITHMDRLRQTMVEAYRRNMTSPDFVYMSFCTYNVPDSFQGTPHWKRNDILDTEAGLAFESLLIITLAHPPVSVGLQSYYEAVLNASRELFNKSQPITDNGKIFGISAHTAVHVTAQVLAEKQEVDILRDGSSFAKSTRNRAFPSVDGQCKLNAKGDRDSLYAVIGITHETGQIEEVLLFDSFEKRLYAAPGTSWTRNTNVPLDRPACGYRDDEGLCNGDGFSFSAVAGSTMATCFFLVGVLAGGSVVVMRRWREQHIYLSLQLDSSAFVFPAALPENTAFSRSFYQRF